LLETGTIVAGYRIDGVLGEGGMGVVYRATQLSLNRTVALKLLAAALSDDAGFRERFRREGQLQAAIDHPHIVTVYEAGQSEHGFFLAMGLVRGPTLKEEIMSRRLEPEHGVRVLSQVAGALDAAHEVGLIHRDVKPQNILIATGDHAYLADFGLTKAPDASSLTETGQFIGTIDYVSPEQARGEGATAKSDVYALAGVLYECLVGEVPYPRPSEPAVLYAHMIEPPPRLSERRPDLPAELDDVISQGMAKDPAERASSAGELMREAQAALGVTAPAAAPTRPAATVGAGGAAETVQVTRPGETGPAAGATRAAGTHDQAAAAPSPAAPPRPEERRRPHVPVAAVAVAAMAVAATAGFLAGGSGSGDGAELTSSASAGSLALSFPDGWRRSMEQAGVPGMRFSDAIELEPPGPAGARATAGMARGSGPTLLPASFRSRLAEVPSPDDPVRLGNADALRYTGLAPEGLDGTATVYAAPTSRGVATVACVAPRGARDFLADCEQVAATLELAGARPYPLGPSEQYARLLAGTTRALERSRADGARRLRAARTPDAQAGVAASLATAYERVSRRLRGAEVSPREGAANARIAAALGAIGAAYDRAAAAARDGDAGAYAAARQAVRRGGARLDRAFKALSALGYSV
jgi:protein kinase-like protein